MLDQTIAELVNILGKRAACAALGRSRATYYRHHRQSPLPARQPRAPRPQPRALSQGEVAVSDRADNDPALCGSESTRQSFPSNRACTSCTTRRTCARSTSVWPRASPPATSCHPIFGPRALIRPSDLSDLRDPVGAQSGLRRFRDFVVFTFVFVVGAELNAFLQEPARTEALQTRSHGCEGGDVALAIRRNVSGPARRRSQSGLNQVTMGSAEVSGVHR